MDTTLRVQLRNGFDHVILVLEHTREDLPEFVLDADGKPIAVNMVEGDVYRVTGTGLESTSHGYRAGDTRVFSFTDREEARAKANRWFEGLLKKGYTRIS